MVLFYPCQEKQEYVWKLIYKRLPLPLKIHLCVFLLGVYIQTQWHHVFLYHLTLVHQPSKQATKIKGCFCKASFTVKGARELFKRSDPSDLVWIARQFWTEKWQGTGLFSSCLWTSVLILRFLWCLSLLILVLYQYSNSDAVLLDMVIKALRNGSTRSSFQCLKIKIWCYIVHIHSGNSSFLHQMTAFGGKLKSDYWNGYHPHPIAESFYLNMPGWKLWWFRSWFTSRSDTDAMGAVVSVREEGKKDRGGKHLKLSGLNLAQFCHTLQENLRWPSSSLRQSQRPEGSWDILTEQVSVNCWTVFVVSGAAPLYLCIFEKSRLFSRKADKLNSWIIEGKQPCSDFCKGM